MTTFAVNPEKLKDTLVQVLGEKVKRIDVALSEINLVVDAADYLATSMLLRDSPACKFEMLLDLCGVDYSAYQDGRYEGQRYAVVLQLLSVTLNQGIGRQGDGVIARLRFGDRRKILAIFTRQTVLPIRRSDFNAEGVFVDVKRDGLLFRFDQFNSFTL